MATAHASADYRNAERTVLVHLESALPGTALVPVGDKRFDASTVDAFVRVALQPVDETPAGRVGGYRATRATTMLVAECYARDNAESGVAAVDVALGLASQVAHAVRLRDLPLRDYATGAGVTVPGVAVRFTSAPKIQHAEPDVSGWDRRIVSAPNHWFIRHAE